MNKSTANIQKMFDDIASSYDFLNHFFTLNFDRLWRKQIVKMIKKLNTKKDVITDLASGTGDLAKAFLKLNPERVNSLDISEKMLNIQKYKIMDRRLKIFQCDAHIIPLDNSSQDIVAVAFGIRNFLNISEVIQEVFRVLKNDGMFVVLEMFGDNNYRSKLFDFYFTKIVPFLGKIISKDKDAYKYLYYSVSKFYTVNQFIDICSDYGFEINYRKNNFLGFIYTLYFKRKQ